MTAAHPRTARDGERYPIDPEAARVRLDHLNEGDLDDPEHPYVRLAAAIRQLSRATVVRPWSLDEAAQVADVVEGLVAAATPTFGTRYAAHESRTHMGPDGIRPNGSGTHPFLGWANPIAPPLVMTFDGRAVVAEVSYDERHEGLPGLVQGGVLASAFDLVLARAAATTGLGGPTGTYSVRFVAPTPILQPLTIRAWATAVEGRKVLVAGEMSTAAGAVTVTATGVMISPSSGHLPTGPTAP